jgi:hypothetical protein
LAQYAHGDREDLGFGTAGGPSPYVLVAFRIWKKHFVDLMNRAFFEMMVVIVE